eukprot:2206909-Rhodomonas_salina.1
MSCWSRSTKPGNSDSRVTPNLSQQSGRQTGQLTWDLRVPTHCHDSAEPTERKETGNSPSADMSQPATARAKPNKRSAGLRRGEDADADALRGHSGIAGSDGVRRVGT